MPHLTSFLQQSHCQIQLYTTYLILVCALFVPASAFPAAHAGCRPREPCTQNQGWSYLENISFGWKLYLKFPAANIHCSEWTLVAKIPLNSSLQAYVLGRGKYWREERNTNTCTMFSSAFVILRKEVWMETGPKLLVSNGLRSKPLNDHCGYVCSSSSSLIYYDIESLWSSSRTVLHAVLRDFEL